MLKARAGRQKALEFNVDYLSVRLIVQLPCSLRCLTINSRQFRIVAGQKHHATVGGNVPDELGVLRHIKAEFKTQHQVFFAVPQNLLRDLTEGALMA
jgi:hypothetical protein